jgi:hypothetical protein
MMRKKSGINKRQTASAVCRWLFLQRHSHQNHKKGGSRHTRAAGIQLLTLKPMDPRKRG